MVRIIAGSARGLTLKVPKGSGTRPTTDRIKETLFNMIGPSLEGKEVLDLFAGTGALGLEALSRGASHAVFIERDRRCAALLEENLRRARCVDRAAVYSVPAPPPRGLLNEWSPFDLVFMDPPYDRGWVARMLLWLDGESALFKTGARVVVERSPKEEIPSNLKNIRPEREKAYRETVLSFLRAV